VRCGDERGGSKEEIQLDMVTRLCHDPSHAGHKRSRSI
jgi:hypothetical protein